MTQIIVSVFLAVLADIESNNDPHAKGKNGELGIYQISAICVQDVNRIYHTQFTHVEMRDPEKAKAVCLLYLSHYAERFRRDTGRDPSAGDLARIWNGGPDGAFKEATADYGTRFVGAYWYKLLDYQTAIHRVGRSAGEARDYLARHFGEAKAGDGT